MLLLGTSLLSSEKRNCPEIVEAVASPDGDLAQRVALIQLEIHVESNKLAPTTNSDQKKDPTHRRLDMCFEWMPSSSWFLSFDFACAAHIQIQVARGNQDRF